MCVCELFLFISVFFCHCPHYQSPTSYFFCSPIPSLSLSLSSTGHKLSVPLMLIFLLMTYLLAITVNVKTCDIADCLVNQGLKNRRFKLLVCKDNLPYCDQNSDRIDRVLYRSIMVHFEDWLLCQAS